MADRIDRFSIYFYHDGKMVEENGELMYCGCGMTPRYNLDIDRFGYFDLEEEVKELGYTVWDGLYYKIPRAKSKMNRIYDDSDVMNMIQQSNGGQYLIFLYVDNGKKGEQTNELQDDVEGSREGVDGGSEVAKDGADDDSEVGKEGDDEDNSTDEDYMPVDASESDDGLSDNELETDDEEYLMARHRRIVDRSGIKKDGRPECSGGVQEDYEDSEGEVNSNSSSSENEPLPGEDCPSQVKKDMIMYDPKCDHKQLTFVLGMRFEGQQQCSSAIQRYAIVNGYDIQFVRTNKKQVEARCVEGCPFSLYASLITSEGRFAVKQLIDGHACSRNMGTRQASARWIASEYKEKFRNNPNWKIEDLEFDLRERYSVQPSKWKLYRGKWMALELLRGSVTEHYGRLRSYMAALIEADNEGRFEFLLGDDSVFKGFFVGFSGLKKGFLRGCRRIIGFDGCFLKTFLGGALLCATGKDGNNQMFPIAWAVVEAENESCWRWFFTILFEELGITDGLGWTFVSDQQKGLTNAIAELTPFAEHRNCARHIYINWKKDFKGQTLKNMFWRCVRSTYMAAYNISTQEMKSENEAAYNAFLEKDPQRFCKTFISTLPRSDMVDNNVSETFNGYIVKARAKHIIDMLECIRTQVMERQYKNLHEMSGVIGRICPRIKKKIDVMIHRSIMCYVTPSIGDKFQVSHENDQFVVDLNSRSCTCRVWELTGIPCIHACSSILWMKRDVSAYVDDCYTVDAYVLAYQNAIPPLNGRNQWPTAIGTPIRPPPFRPMPGRPKKKRKRGPEEEKQSSTKLKRFGLQMTCQKCLKVGHNKRSCTNEAVEKPQKRKRGRPPMEGTNPRARGRPPRNATRSEITSQSVQTDNQSASTSVARARDRAVVKKGFGIHVGAETGNIYMRMPGDNRVHFVASKHVGSSSSRATRGRRGRVNPVRAATGRITRQTNAGVEPGTQESATK